MAKYKVNLPVIVINFKTFKEATAKKAVSLAKKCEKVAKETNTEIMIAVQAADIYRVSKAVSTPVIAEHIDAIEPDAHTGHILAEDVKQNGAIGTLLNHSEDRMDFNVIKTCIHRADEAGLVTVVCAVNPEMAAKIAGLKPDFIAIEPPELIGGEISVSEAKPEVITSSLEKIKQIPVLCGAGIKTKHDVKKAIELGAAGILVASGITKAKNPESALRELVDGLK